MLRKAIAMIACISGSALRADDTPLDKVLTYSLVEQCLRASDRADPQGQRIATELASREGVQLPAEARFQGMKCLKLYFGERFFFDPVRGAFISETEERQVMRERSEQQAAMEEMSAEYRRRSALLRAVYERRLRAACVAKLQEDEFEALTEPLCAEVFKRHGFSD